MSRKPMLLALLVSVAACAAASEPPEAPAPLEAPALVESTAPVVAVYDAEPAAAYRAQQPACAIDVTRINGGVRLEARAFDLADAPPALEYDFVVTKQGGAGSSDIVQAGEVSEEELGSVDLSLERGARYRARLTLSDADGEICTTQVRS